MRRSRGEMVKLGITGGVGSGKSLVLEYLEQEWGAAVYQADRIAHQVQEPGTACYEKVVESFGREILRADGAIDRQKLGALVFADPAKLRRLNAIVHPAVERRVPELMRDEERRGCRLFVLEAALLTQEVYLRMLDEIWYVHVEEAVRRQRLRDSRGYSEERMDEMLASQPSEQTFRRVCSRVIENGGDFSLTQRQLDRELADLLSGAHGGSGTDSVPGGDGRQRTASVRRAPDGNGAERAKDDEPGRESK